MDEDLRRAIAAELTALKFVVEVLLAQHMRRCSPAEKEAFIASLLRVGSKFDHLKANTDAEAEEIADIAILSHQRLERIVANAKERAEG